MTVGYQNMNPLNLIKTKVKWQGEVRPSQHARFMQFESFAYGYRASLITLRTYFWKHGRDTISKIVNRWAPPGPPDYNNTDNYIKTVSERAGVDKDFLLDFDKDTDLYIRICAAMSYFENGIEPDMAEIRAGYNLMGKKQQLTDHERSVYLLKKKIIKVIKIPAENPLYSILILAALVAIFLFVYFKYLRK